jgi:hypothetical protein
MTPEPMTAEQFIAQLDELAKVEHALCVEYLSVHCALGHDRGPGPDASAHEHAVHDAARAAMNLAMDEMRHLHGVNRALVAARGEAQVARAESVGGVTIGRLGAAELERLADREGAIAAAIDAIYQRLCAVLAAQPTLFQDPTLAEVSSLLDPCPDHSTPLAAVLQPLAGIPPSEYVRARPRDPDPQSEEATLVEGSERAYRALVPILATWFEHEDDLFQMRSIAVDTMESLNAFNELLGARGVLPPFGFA